MIPEEIIQFFENPGGHSLIIKGPPGSGKTTLTLEILHEFLTKRKVLYLSVRIHDQVILEHFPWVENIIVERRERKREASRKELNILEGNIENGLSKELVKMKNGEIILEVGEMLPELENVYGFVEKHGGNVMIAIDSIDGLSEGYGVPGDKIFWAIQKDLVETGVADVIFVEEGTKESPIEHLGDGIIYLRHEPWGSFWKRTMEIRKLRGAEIKKAYYVFSLHNARFTTLRYAPFPLGSSNINFDELSDFLKKFEECKVINMVVSDDFPRELIGTILLSLAKNSKGNVIVLPPTMLPGSEIRSICGESSKIKVIGLGGEKGEIHLEIPVIPAELYEVIEELQEPSAMTIIGVDTFKKYGGNINDLPYMIDKIKRISRVVLLTPESVSVRFAEREIHLRMMDDVPVIVDDFAYGVHRGEKDDKIRMVPMA